MSDKPLSESLIMAGATILATLIVFIGSASLVGTWFALVWLFGRNVYRWLT